MRTEKVIRRHKWGVFGSVFQAEFGQRERYRRGKNEIFISLLHVVVLLNSGLRSPVGHSDLFFSTKIEALKVVLPCLSLFVFLGM